MILGIPEIPEGHSFHIGFTSHFSCAGTLSGKPLGPRLCRVPGPFSLIGTPLAFWLGVVFYFLEVMPMFCPYPTTCEWDAYRKTGVHFCNIGKCQYSLTAKAMLEHEIGLLEQIRHRTERQEQVLERLYSQLREIKDAKR